MNINSRLGCYSTFRRFHSVVPPPFKRGGTRFLGNLKRGGNPKKISRGGNEMGGGKISLEKGGGKDFMTIFFALFSKSRVFQRLILKKFSPAAR